MDLGEKAFLVFLGALACWWLMRPRRQRQYRQRATRAGTPTLTLVPPVATESNGPPTRPEGCA